MSALLTMAFFFSGFFIVLTPLPILYVLTRRGNKAWIEFLFPVFALVGAVYVFAVPTLHHFYSSNPAWSWLLSVPGIGFLDSASLQAVTLFGFGALSFYTVIAFAVHRKKNVLLTVAISYLIGIAGFQFYALTHGSSASDLVAGYVQKMLADFLAIQQAGKAPLEQIALVKENSAGFSFLCSLLFPSLFFNSLLFVLIVNFALGRRLLVLLGKKTDGLKLNEWKVPFEGVWLTIAAIGLGLANTYFLKSNLALALAANFLVILAFIYTLQGLGILSFFLEEKKVRPFGRFFLYSFIFILFQPFILLITGFGFFDSWADLRSKIRVAKK